MHDDRADAAIWSILHLAGSNQGNWGAVYGFDDCPGCGARVNFDKDQRCHNCGREVTAPTPKHAGGMPARVPWSDAYLKSCPNGHKYTPREPSCPQCAPSPETFIARALAGQGGAGKYAYTGKDWLRGRHF
jgi:hypothetical protein